MKKVLLSFGMLSVTFIFSMIGCTKNDAKKDWTQNEQESIVDKGNGEIYLYNGSVYSEDILEGKEEFEVISAIASENDTNYVFNSIDDALVFVNNCNADEGIREKYNSMLSYTKAAREIGIENNIEAYYEEHEEASAAYLDQISVLNSEYGIEQIAEKGPQTLGVVGAFYDNCAMSGANILSITYPFLPKQWRNRISLTAAISGTGFFGYHKKSFFFGGSLYSANKKTHRF